MRGLIAKVTLVGFVTIGWAMLACSANGATWDVYAGQSIQAAVNSAGPGDTITIHAGSYEQQVIIPTGKAGLTLQGDGTMPLINPDLGTTTYATVIKVKSDNVTIHGLEIASKGGLKFTSGGRVVEQHGIWDDTWTTGPAGLTVDGVKIRDVGHGVRSYGDRLTVTNCEMTGLGRSGIHPSGPSAGIPLSMTIKNNWFHDWGAYDKEGAAVYVSYDRRYGEVSFNYISGMRMGLAYYYGGPNDAADALGGILFSHNTVDMAFLGGPVNMTMGMSFWGTGANADGIIVSDNIFANARWYALYQEGATISGGSLLIDNNLFFNNNHYYWPGNQYPYQWFGDEVRAAAGWYDGPANGFTFTDNFTALDPLFAATGLTADEFWALLAGSPALKSASDGLNIGAWQGQPTVIPEPLSAVIWAGLICISLVVARRFRG